MSSIYDIDSWSNNSVYKKNRIIQFNSKYYYALRDLTSFGSPRTFPDDWRNRSWGAQIVKSSARTLECFDSTDFTITSPHTKISFCCWVYFDSLPAASGGDVFYTIISKDDADASIEYSLGYRKDGSVDRFEFRVSSSGAAGGITTVGSSTSASVNTWYFVACWHDPITDKIKISVNNQTTPDSADHSAGIFNGATSLNFGRLDNDSNPYYFNGRIDGVSFFMDYVFTTNDISTLYNGGLGLHYHSLPSSLSSILTAHWDLEESSGNRSDSSGDTTHRLVETNGTVNQAAGVDDDIGNDRWGGIYFDDRGVAMPHFFWVPDYNYEVVPTNRVKNVRFGDGYIYRQPDGINNVQLEINLTFSNRDLQEVTAITHFLVTRAGHETFVFLPRPPYSRMKYFICQDFSDIIPFYNNYQVRAKFTEIAI